MSVLRRGKIWALNIGESWHVTRQGWEEFAHGTVAALLFFKPSDADPVLLPGSFVFHQICRQPTSRTCTLPKEPI